jgi:hypothetical protein
MRGSLEGKKEALVERETQAQRAQAKCHYVGAASLKMLERLRQRGFKQVFDALDDNNVLWGCMLRREGKIAIFATWEETSLGGVSNLRPHSDVLYLNKFGLGV